MTSDGSSSSPASSWSWPVSPSRRCRASGSGRLPGDFVYRRGNFTLYVPLMTSILLSIALTVILWLFRR
ncbi:MAG TPA: DUF2905 domain-containing protein [Thermoanaerobaculia bacterium]|nr:DUF2905 domain-containing protein [Thermoanaerobaculia bacterium]